MFVVSAVANSPRGQVLQEDESQSALLLASVRAVPDLLPSITSGCADWMAGCIDRSLSDGDLRNTLVAPSAPPSSSSSLAHDAAQEAETKRRRLLVWPRER